MGNTFYTEAKLHRFASCPVAFSTLSLAEADAARASHDCAHVLVWDCTASPVGKLVCKYVKGERVEPTCSRCNAFSDAPCTNSEGRRVAHHVERMAQIWLDLEA